MCVCVCVYVCVCAHACVCVCACVRVKAFLMLHSFSPSRIKISLRKKFNLHVIGTIAIDCFMTDSFIIKQCQLQKE